MANPKCRVLCVDDHRDTSEMLQMLLAEEDYVVHTAATVEEACKMAGETRYDLYVLDKRLPDGTGMELCETLMKISPAVPCIFYTGDAYEIHRREAFAAGAAAQVGRGPGGGEVGGAHEAADGAGLLVEPDGARSVGAGRDGGTACADAAVVVERRLARRGDWTAMKGKAPVLILASASPRRRALRAAPRPSPARHLRPDPPLQARPRRR